MKYVCKGLIGEVLWQLKTIGGVESSAVITRDGLLVASDVSTDVNAETFAAMSASMVGSAETAITEAKAGTTTRVIMETDNSKMIALGASAKALLVVLTKRDVPLGLILLKAGDAAREISGLVD